MTANRIIAVDPGKRTGIAILKFGGELVRKQVIPFEDISSYWAALGREFPDGTIHAVVCESFRLYARLSTQQHGSSMETSQVVGMARGYSALHGINFVEQQPDARNFGAKFVQYKLGRGHTPDDISAWLHGIFYLKSINQLTTNYEKDLQDGN